MKEREGLVLDSNEVATFKSRMVEALSIFGVGISKKIVYLSILYCVPISRIGGHNDGRNSDHSSMQKGSSKSADDHGINQANQYKTWRDEVIKRCVAESHVAKEKARIFVNALERQERELLPANSAPKGKDKGRAHTPRTQHRVAQDKDKNKAEQTIKKKESWAKSQQPKFSSFAAQFNTKAAKNNTLGI